MLRIVHHIAIAGLLMSSILMAAGCNDLPTTSTQTTIVSEGIGATKAQWGRTHQLVKNILDNDYIYGEGDVPFSGYNVIFWQQGGAKPEDRIVAISVDALLVLSDTKRIPPVDNNVTQLTEEQMHEVVQMFLPKDAQLQSKNTYRGDGPIIIEIYFSKSLSTLFAPLPSVGLPWGKDAPGTLNVLHYGGVRG